MAENSKINWTTHTFNPWIGCTKVSPGCLHCYAETLMDTRYGRVKWGAGNPRSRTAPSNWKKVRSWSNHAARDGIRPRVFCASLADWVDDEVPAEWLADLLELIRTTPNLDWLLLTKRPASWGQRMIDCMNTRAGSPLAYSWYIESKAPENVWIGTTAEDQQRADERIEKLRQIPSRVRFLSCEPMLSEINLFTAASIGKAANNADVRDYGEPWIDWVICGGESGPSARPMQIEWAESLRAQCAASGLPFWMKQMGGVTNSRHELADIPEHLRVRELPVAA